MADSSEAPPRPSLKLYAQMVEVYADQPKIDHHEASVWLGLPRVMCEHAYKKGWRGNKRGTGALAPIKDQLARMRYGAAALTEKLERVVTEEGEKELVAALRDGTVKRAVEGLVSRSLLKVIQEQADNAVALQVATKPLVERLISQLTTLASVKQLTMVEIKAELAFVQSYVRETVLVTDRYHALEKARDALKPAKEEDKEKLANSTKTEAELLDALMESVAGIKNALSNKEASTKLLKAPKIIDVTPEP